MSHADHSTTAGSTLTPAWPRIVGYPIYLTLFPMAYDDLAMTQTRTASTDTELDCATWNTEMDLPLVVLPLSSCVL